MYYMRISYSRVPRGMANETTTWSSLSLTTVVAWKEWIDTTYIWIRHIYVHQKQSLCSAKWPTVVYFGHELSIYKIRSILFIYPLLTHFPFQNKALQRQLWWWSNVCCRRCTNVCVHVNVKYKIGVFVPPSVVGALIAKRTQENPCSIYIFIYWYYYIVYLSTIRPLSIPNRNSHSVEYYASVHVQSPSGRYI